MEQAAAVGGDDDVLLFGGRVVQQALPLGLVDQVRLHVNAVLLAAGHPSPAP